jgi:uncharacterized membrane protein
MRHLIVGLLTLLYPLLVYFGLGHWEPRYLALLLAAVAIARALATRDTMWRVASAGALLLAAVSVWGNHALPLKLYPVLVSAVLLTVFGASLLHPPTAIERIARLREPGLNAAGVSYTRTVTQVWCGFFVLNGGISLATAVWASESVWALYNGLIAYGLMGLLFAGEWLVRQRVKARHV